MDSPYKLFWGDSHSNLHLVMPGFQEAHFPAGGATATNLPREVAADLDAALEHAQAVLDFWPIAYYPYTYRLENGFRVEGWRDERELAVAWRAICALAASGNSDGDFVIFPGFEWQGDNRHGDHNVFFLTDHPPLLDMPTLPELYAEIRRRGLKALVIPHHTAYRTGFRGKDWGVHDEQLSPFAEIFSNHGCSESDEEWIGLRRNWHMGPGVSGGAIEDGLDRGIRVGIIASTDEHNATPGTYGRGLMGCHAQALTREALWEAFQARRVYGVTGDRIRLDFSVEGAPMGGAIARSGPVRTLARVRGCDAIDRIELLRNNRPIAAHCHGGTWSAPAGGGRIRAKLRVEVGWGPKRDDLADMPPQQWTGRLQVPDGAVLSAEPCWRRRGQRLGSPDGGQCDFGFVTTSSPPPHGGVPTEAAIFEIEARPQDTLRLELNGKTVTMTLGEAMAGSQIVSFMDEAKALVRRTYGIDSDALFRTDRVYFYSYKAKIHRAVPDEGLTAELAYTDADPPGGVNHYRVRVTQRNGQVAWSSPVWVQNG